MTAKASAGCLAASTFERSFATRALTARARGRVRGHDLGLRCRFAARGQALDGGPCWNRDEIEGEMTTTQETSGVTDRNGAAGEQIAPAPTRDWYALNTPIAVVKWRGPIPAPFSSPPTVHEVVVTYG